MTVFHVPVPCIHVFLADSIFLFQNRTGIPSLISMNHYPTVSNVAIENPPFLWCSQLSESIRGFSSFPASHLKSYRRVIWPKIQSISTSSWSSSPWSYPWHSLFVWAVFKTLCCLMDCGHPHLCLLPSDESPKESSTSIYQLYNVVSTYISLFSWLRTCWNPYEQRL